jgi:hypothetical protein
MHLHEFFIFMLVIKIIFMFDENFVFLYNQLHYLKKSVPLLYIFVLRSNLGNT